MEQRPDQREVLKDVPRVLVDLRAPEPGPTLLCVGGIHGNEPAGVIALRRVAAKLGRDGIGMRGRFVALAGNRRALAAGRRFLARDLNRIFSAENVRAVNRPGFEPDAEQLELRQLAAAIEDFRAGADGAPWFLDLHTTSGRGPAFVTIEDTLPNRRFAEAFPAPVVLGIEEELLDTLANYMSAGGAISVGFESGQHGDPRSIERAEAAIWIALETSGVLPRRSRDELSWAYRSLERERNGVPRVVEVRYRHPIRNGDGFRMLPGLAGFDRIAPGQTIAFTADGPVTATRHGLLLMPLYQEQGEDGFFVVRRVQRFWLAASALVRRLGIDAWIDRLPGVERHPELPRTFVVDRRRARWLALQLFHLLGFKRMGKRSRFLVMSRRSDDRWDGR